MHEQISDIVQFHFWSIYHDLHLKDKVDFGMHYMDHQLKKVLDIEDTESKYEFHSHILHPLPLGKPLHLYTYYKVIFCSIIFLISKYIHHTSYAVIILLIYFL